MSNVLINCLIIVSSSNGKNPLEDGVGNHPLFPIAFKASDDRVER